jgi:hypothetical protein
VALPQNLLTPKRHLLSFYEPKVTSPVCTVMRTATFALSNVNFLRCNFVKVGRWLTAIGRRLLGLSSRVRVLNTLKKEAADSCKSGYLSTFFTDVISCLSYTQFFKLVSGTILFVFEHAVHTFSSINLQQKLSQHAVISQKTLISLPYNMLGIYCYIE